MGHLLQQMSVFKGRLKQECRGPNLGPTAHYSLQASAELQQVRQLEAQNDQLVRENNELKALLVIIESTAQLAVDGYLQI